jgi:PhnB protein
MAEAPESPYEARDLRAIRPYLIVNDADAAMEFYRVVFEARELERHSTPSGGVGHAKFQIGETILEIGEHPDARGREAEALPRLGLRVYVADVDQTCRRATAAGARVDPPSERLAGSRSATVYDPFGVTWWLVTKI